MSLANKARAAASVAQARLLGRRTPLAICWLVTSRCNSQCSYCDIWRREVPDLPTADVLRVVSEMADMGTQRISLFGGEPLMRDDIGVIVRAAKERGLQVGLGSNGALVPELIDEVRSADLLHLSLDGPREVHDLQRGRGSFDRVMEAIHAARLKGVEVWTSAVLTRHNLGSVDWLVDTAERLRVPVYFQPVMDRPLSEHNDHLYPEPEPYRAAIRRVAERERRSRYVINSPRSLEYLLQWPSPTVRIPCRSKLLRALVDTNGDVYPCERLIGKWPARNAAREGFAAAFGHTRTAECSDELSRCLSYDYANIEFNLLFSLEPRTVLKAIRMSP